MKKYVVKALRTETATLALALVAIWRNVWNEGVIIGVIGGGIVFILYCFLAGRAAYKERGKDDGTRN